MICGIYCIENKVNGKKYIGQSTNIKERWNQHCGDLRSGFHYNKRLKEDWDSYGEDNFIFYILEICDKAELEEKEMYYISKFQTYEKGYNYTLGGKGNKGLSHSMPKKERIPKVLSERQLKSREHIMQQFKDLAFLEAFQRNINSQMTPIKCYNQEGYIRDYSNIHEAANDLQAEATNICKVLKGKHKTCKGYTFCYQDEELSNVELQQRYSISHCVDTHSRTSHGKATVEVFDLQGKSLGQFDSIRQASLSFNLDPSSVTAVCRGKLKQTHGYIIEYRN